MGEGAYDPVMTLPPSHAEPVEPDFQRLVLFDGVCAVCDASVQWILDHDPDGLFHFAPLHSDLAQSILARHPELPDKLDSIVLVEKRPDGTERVSWYSAAILSIAARLGLPWSLVAAARVVPQGLRDPFYRGFAKVRYRVFGKLDRCRLPEPEWESRFLGEVTAG